MIFFRINLNILFILIMVLLAPIMAKETTKAFQLDNGLHVILLHDPSAEIITAKTIVNVGSIYEKEFLGTGISHYLEHIVAGGSTKKQSEETYKKYLTKNCTVKHTLPKPHKKVRWFFPLGGNDDMDAYLSKYNTSMKKLKETYPEEWFYLNVH